MRAPPGGPFQPSSSAPENERGGLLSAAAFALPGTLTPCPCPPFIDGRLQLVHALPSAASCRLRSCPAASRASRQNCAAVAARQVVAGQRGKASANGRRDRTASRT